MEKINRIAVYLIGAASVLWLVGFLRVVGQVDSMRGTITLLGLFTVLILVAIYEQVRRNSIR